MTRSGIELPLMLYVKRPRAGLAQRVAVLHPQERGAAADVQHTRDVRASVAHVAAVPLYDREAKMARR